MKFIEYLIAYWALAPIVLPILLLIVLGIIRCIVAMGKGK